MISCSPRRPMRWNAAIGTIARCKATSIASARKRKSVRVLRWICGVKPKLKAGNTPWRHFIVHGLDKPGVFTTVSIFHLPDGDVRAMLFVIAFDGGFIGVTAVNRERLRDPVPADRLLQKPQCGLCIPLLGE